LIEKYDLLITHEIYKEIKADLDRGATVIKTQEEFEKIEKESGNKLVVIDVYADWCGPCVSFAPTYKSIGYEFLEKATFLKVNGDENKWAMS